MSEPCQVVLVQIHRNSYRFHPGSESCCLVEHTRYSSSYVHRGCHLCGTCYGRSKATRSFRSASGSYIAAHYDCLRDVLTILGFEDFHRFWTYADEGRLPFEVVYSD